MVDPRRLLTFREVARRGSFSDAARALSLSQPAVSQQVAALETEVRLQLLERGAGGLTLTDAGRLTLDHADALFGRIELVTSQLGQLAADEAGSLRLGASPSLLATFVPTAVERLRNERDGLQASIIEGLLGELARAVGEGRLHAAVCFQDSSQPRNEHEGTQRTDIFEEPFRAVLPKEHRLAGRKRIRLSDLAGDLWAMPSRTGLVMRACREAGFEPRVGYLITDPMATRAVVMEGQAVTLSPASYALGLPDVRSVALSGPNAHRTVYGLLPATGASPLAEGFLDAFRSVTAHLR
jgi:DNA-binding transcriptional LysR family regulator